MSNDVLFEGYTYSSDLTNKYANQPSNINAKYIIENITTNAYGGNYSKLLVIRDTESALYSINGWTLNGIYLFFSWVYVSEGDIQITDPKGQQTYIDSSIFCPTIVRRSPTANYHVTVGYRITEVISAFEKIAQFKSIDELVNSENLKEFKLDISYQEFVKILRRS